MTKNALRAILPVRRLLLGVIGLVLVASSLVAATPAQAAGWVSARWPAYSQPLNRTVWVTGHVHGTHLGNSVALERRVMGGWQIVARASLDQYRNYRLQVPTWWFGVRSYRVVTQGSIRRATLPRDVGVVPTYRPSGYASQYAWASRTPTRWDPCGVIGWRINATQGTAGALYDARVAFHRLSEATGLRFVYRGTTTGIPQYGGNSWYPRDTQIVVAWARRHQSSLFGLYPGAVGVGAALSSGGYYNGNGTATNRITKGMVVLDSTVRYRAGFGWGRTRGDLLMHELGHAVGLGHTSARSQLMYPYVTDGYARYGHGDLRAMYLRGTRGGCLTRSSGGIALTVNIGGGMRDQHGHHLTAMH